MMKIHISKLLVVLCLLSTIGVITSCDKTITIEQIIDVGGAGRFYGINVSANDTVEIDETINNGNVPRLNVKDGDEIRLCFVPNSKYKMYSFNVSYILPDSKSVKGEGKEYSYVFINKGLDPTRNHTISMSALSTEQTITSFGKINLKITE